MYTRQDLSCRHLSILLRELLRGVDLLLDIVIFQRRLPCVVTRSGLEAAILASLRLSGIRRRAHPSQPSKLVGCPLVLLRQLQRLTEVATVDQAVEPASRALSVTAVKAINMLRQPVDQVVGKASQAHEHLLDTTPTAPSTKADGRDLLSVVITPHCTGMGILQA